MLLFAAPSKSSRGHIIPNLAFITFLRCAFSSLCFAGGLSISTFLTTCNGRTHPAAISAVFQPSLSPPHPVPFITPPLN